MTVRQLRPHRPDPSAHPGDRPTPLAGESPHLGWTADTHCDELPHGLFPRLGARFVRRWHQAHVESPHGRGYVVVRDNRPIAFALGSTDRGANVAWLLKHRRDRLVPAAALALLRRPRLLLTFLATRAGRYARRLWPSTSLRGPEPTPRGGGLGQVAVLEAIVVAPEHRGQGLGRRLVETFLADARVAGADTVELVTKDGAAGAAGFYERVHWQVVGRHTDRDGDIVLTFRTTLHPLPPVA